MLTMPRAATTVAATALLATLAYVRPADGALRGSVTDKSGKPVPGAMVMLTWVPGSGRGDAMPESRELKVTADADGQFRAEGIPPGKWSVRCSAESYYEKRELDVGGGFSFPKPKHITVSAGETISLPLVLLQVAYLVGEVRDESGQLLKGEEVFVVPPRSMHFPVKAARVRLDETGTFREQYTFEGKYALGVYRQERYAPHRTFRLESGARTRVVFRLTRPARLSGVVVGPDGKPPAGRVRVSADGWLDGNDSSSGLTLPFRVKPGIPFHEIEWCPPAVDADEAGRFEMELDPGVRYRLYATGDGGYTDDRDQRVVCLSPGETRRGVRLVLTPPARE